MKSPWQRTLKKKKSPFFWQLQSQLIFSPQLPPVFWYLNFMCQRCLVWLGAIIKAVLYYLLLHSSEVMKFMLDEMTLVECFKVFQKILEDYTHAMLVDIDFSPNKKRNSCKEILWNRSCRHPAKFWLIIRISYDRSKNCEDIQYSIIRSYGGPCAFLELIYFYPAAIKYIYTIAP